MLVACDQLVSDHVSIVEIYAPLATARWDQGVVGEGGRYCLDTMCHDLTSSERVVGQTLADSRQRKGKDASTHAPRTLMR